MIFAKITIQATPEQVERKYHRLTDWQKKQVQEARTFRKLLNVTVIDIDNLAEKILYDVSVCHE